MVDLMGLDVNIINTGNFQNVCLFDPNNGSQDSFGAVSHFQKMDTSALNYMQSIQPNDYDLGRKLHWMGLPDNPKGRPYMYKNGVACWGLMVFGFNKIQVEAVNGVPVPYIFRARYQSRSYVEDIEMYKLVMFRKADMLRPVAELISEGLIHHATEAFLPDNGLGESPRGVILNPVWSPQDWPTNTGFHDDLYIPKVFLKDP